jgi:hypothetical protein
VAVDLGRAEESDVDAFALEPVGEHLRDGDDRVRGLGELAVPDRERQLLRLCPDRAALVDQDAVRRVGRTREVRSEARQPDPDEADSAVVEPPRGLDGHHLVRLVACVHAATPAASTCSSIHAVKRSRSREISSQRM